MEKKDRDEIFDSFLKKAEQRLEDKKTMRTCVMHVPSLDADIKLRGLSKSEIAEVLEVDDADEIYASDRYSVYLAAVEPDLKALAVQLKEAGKIKQYTDVMDIFEPYEIKALAQQIMVLSGMVEGGNRVSLVVDGLKNS